MPIPESTSQINYKDLILVVDDNRDAVNILARYLDNEGYSVRSALSGTDALAVVADLQPDLILLDVMMPGLNGYDVFQSLQKNPLTASIPVIFVTARDNPKEVEIGLGLGADDFIGKPVDPRNLIARVRNKIELSRLRKALHKRTTDLEALLHLSQELIKHLNVDNLLDVLIDILPTIFTNCSEYLIFVNATSYRHRQQDEETRTDSRLLIQLAQSVLGLQTNSPTLPYALYPHIAVSLLNFADEVHGYIALFSYVPFSDSQQRLLDSVAQQSTLAIRNAEMYELKQNYATKLEETVSQRTEELRSAHRLLVRSEKLAAVGRFAQVMSHEVRNPLHVIGLLIEEMMVAIKANEDVKLKDLEVALHSSQRATRFVERLLEFTRQGKTSTQGLERINISQVFRNPISLGEALYKRKRLRLNYTLQHMPFIEGHRDSLEQVFLNLIVNAADAMEAGGTLSITSEIVDNELVLYFQDEGCGIAPENIDKIFEPSFTTKEQGTGIGLFISYEIIANHNGSIDFFSEVGKGTTFVIRLPIAEMA